MPRSALIGGGALLTTMVILIALTLHEISASRDHIASQDEKLSVLLESSDPVLDEVAPLARDAQPLLDAAAPLTDDLAAAASLAAGAGRTLEPTIDRLPPIAVMTQALLSDLGPAIQTLGPTLGAARLLLTRAEESDLLGRALRSFERLRRILRIQRQTLSLQRRLLSVQRRGVRVQRRSPDHVRSLDRKTGGEFPPP
jgi:ABC-type transporter Mla subunit MlaD